MRKYLTFCILLIFYYSNGQNSFEGIIKFKTEISTTDLSPKDFKQKLLTKYGDSSYMYYSKNGDFKRKNINSGKLGVDAQFYNAKKGVIYYIKNDTDKIDITDVKLNSISIIISKDKIANEKIIGLDCECMRYTGITKHNETVTITYCYSLLTPKIDYKLFQKHNDFFLNEYYQSSERPYLKFSLETPRFTLKYTATKIEEVEIENEVFQVKK